MHYIYRISNRINGKVYIGQTNNAALRWSQHKHNARNNKLDQVITRAIVKYGVDFFDFIVIASCQNQADADLTETLLITQYDSRNPLKGYNIDAGGISGPRAPEVGQKISESLRKHYEEHESILKGIPLSDEHKQNMSIAAMGKAGTNNGKVFSQEWVAKIASGNKGKIRTEEVKKKLSDSHMGQIPSNRKLTIEIAEEIRREYSTGLYSQKQLGFKYDLSQSCIFKIVNMQSYIKDKV